ncbi:GNAT family N-acetyltransferase [Flocculibacter collagenilyticus]|uniref:GNAT family N-acetyltransferase n=1 Tax=Flocculibacter collagenilyticus TaxID=2744479 RepID=UPI0018F469CC|nr:GNAT family N-acetyltransferase [Flocculibacter collagenilyticus]
MQLFYAFNYCGQALEKESTMAHALTHQSFFNSLLAETTIARYSNNTVTLPLDTSKSLILPLTYCSPALSHRYTGEIYLYDEKAAANQAHEESGVLICFEQAVELVMNSLFDDVDVTAKTRFMLQVKNSNDYITRAQCAAIDRINQNTELSTAQAGFIASEQMLTAGHSMHPSPKSCAPLNEAQQQQFLPEFAQTFSLQWFAVKRSFLAGQIQSEPADNAELQAEPELDRLATQLLAFYAHCTSNDVTALPSQEWVPLPMHPLQAAAWKQSVQAETLKDAVIELVFDDAAIASHRATQGWTATSSSRAIYHPDSPWMLKVSLPVKLTNSLRLMTEKEARRGTQFSQLLNTASGDELKQRLPSLTFMEEPMWCSINDHNNVALDLPLVCFRQNHFYVEDGQAEQASVLQDDEVFLLATANQKILSQQPAKIAQWILAYAEQSKLSHQQAARQWFDKFFEHVIAPLTITRSDYGIVLLAHQQNILLKIKDNLPVGMVYRDCQGIGLTDAALTRFNTVLDNEKPEYFEEAERVNPYLAYYVIGNTLLNTISTIAAEGLISEGALWLLCQDKFNALRSANPIDPSFYDYVLHSATLRWKRNFYCFLSGQNEATLTDPTKIYCDINNVFRQPDELRNTIYKPLPQGRTLALTDELYQLESNAIIMHQPHEVRQIQVREYGETVAQYRITFHHTNVAEEAQVRLAHIETIFNDSAEPLIWWSVAEHALMAYKVEYITTDNWPQSVLTHFNHQKQLSATRLYRHEFLQIAPLWHCKSGTQPSGVLYRRYFYHLKRTLTLRVIDIERDLACFHLWHNDEGIAPVWELAGTKQSHIEYLTKLANMPHQFGVMGEFDGVPFGYFEVYWAADDRLAQHYESEPHDRGVHMLVGNRKFRGAQYFDTWSKAILQFCFLDEPNTYRVLGEPNAKNKRVIEITARCGMEKQFEFDFPHKRAALLQCERERFFKHFSI